jgi:hypothetical protein
LRGPLFGRKAHRRCSASLPRQAGAGGMTKWRLVAFIKSSQIGWTKGKQQVPPLRSEAVTLCLLFASSSGEAQRGTCFFASPPISQIHRAAVTLNFVIPRACDFFGFSHFLHT